ncbi:hypothetical protein [Bacillus pseudomycoides]|uniref:hypothetical protein n=1 Tax=Bacillus pseudomycoides TaxID=64104 RepID=UPI001FB1DD5A|nr:hypothetical protein [Bacillus pseudomycoides]
MVEMFIKRILTELKETDYYAILKLKSNDKKNDNGLVFITEQENYASFNLKISNIISSDKELLENFTIRYGDHPMLDKENSSNGGDEISIQVIGNNCWNKGDIFIEKKWKSAEILHSELEGFVKGKIIDLFTISDDKNDFYSMVRRRSILQRLPYVHPYDKNSNTLVRDLGKLDYVKSQNEEDPLQIYKDAFTNWEYEKALFVEEKTEQMKKQGLRVIDWV